MNEDLDDALINFFQSIKLNNKYYRSYEEIGFIYVQMGFINDALNYFQKALDIYNSPESLFGKYYCLKKMGKIKEANYALNKACILDPKYKNLI